MGGKEEGVADLTPQALDIFLFYEIFLDIQGRIYSDGPANPMGGSQTVNGAF